LKQEPLKTQIMFCQQPTNCLSDIPMLNLGSSVLDTVLFITIAEGLAKRDPANTEWQRDLFVSKAKIGDVLLAQGDGPGALAEYQAGLTIAEGLAKRVPANTKWQVDVAVSYAKLGSLDSLVSMQQRKEYLSRGLELLSALKQAGRLHPNQDWASWFDNALRSLK
jgi:hypothetical protein